MYKEEGHPYCAFEMQKELGRKLLPANCQSFHYNIVNFPIKQVSVKWGGMGWGELSTACYYSPFHC